MDLTKDNKKALKLIFREAYNNIYVNLHFMSSYNLLLMESEVAKLELKILGTNKIGLKEFKRVSNMVLK